MLGGLTKKPFEPLSQADLQHLTLKTLLLALVTSARRVSELGAELAHMLYLVDQLTERRYVSWPIDNDS